MPAVFSAAAAATLLPLLLYASRGTFFTRAFWGGWLQALVMYGATGVGALPIAELPDFALLLFAAMVSVYLGVIAYAVVQGWHGRASSGEVLMATLASYGLAVLLLFVGRSHPFNLCHTTPPFAVLLTALILRCYHALPRLLQRSGFAYALLAGIVLLLLTKPQFRSYPSLLGSAFQSSPSPGVSLRTNPPDICGLPPVYEGSARLVQALCSTIRTLAPDGKGVAILDLTDTMLYSVAEACPWSRYTSLFRMGMTQQSLQDMRNELIARSPKYAVIRAPSAPRPAEWEFVWAPLYATVTNRYVLQQTLGPFEVWRDSQQP